METTANKNTATIHQLSAFSQYFFPLGNFIFPALIWSLKKNDSEFVDYNGKQSINFQLSIFLYSLLLLIIAIPVFIYTLLNNINYTVGMDGDWVMEQFTMGKITGLILIGMIATLIFISLKVAEFFLIIYASIKNNNGEPYNYPLTIKFIK